MEIEKEVTRVKKRVRTVEDAIVLLTGLTDNHNDQIEKVLFGIDELRGSVAELRHTVSEQRANQENSDFKLNALIDAQIRAEDEMREMREYMKSAHTRIDRLEKK